MQTTGLWRPGPPPEDGAWNDVPAVIAKEAAPTDQKRRLHMQWQTPCATDLRFGFEITMYVAAR